ncbi:MAG: ArsA-related P-loop ATPase [Bdellovibrionota bacterium]
MDFKKAEILICLGTGGVGKTTVAATLGLLAAKQGLKTLVMTIDPSKRLAQTLGIEGKVGISHVPFEGEKIPLDATVIDHKKVFDDFLRQAMEKKGGSDKIFKNKLYQELSTTLSGSQEFTCLEVLYQAHESGKYDLVILDTPPASHAMDFLQAPQKLAGLFQKETVQWFTQPGESTSLIMRVFQSGTQKVLGLLEGITGSEFIGSLKEFFQGIGPWSSEILNRTHQFHDLLVEETTHFYLVTAPDPVSLRESKSLAKEVFKGGYHLKKIIFNRAHQPWDEAPKDSDLEGSKEMLQDLTKQYKEFEVYFERRHDAVKAFMTELPQKTKGVLLPEFEKDISNLETLNEFSKVFNDEKVL